MGIIKTDHIRVTHACSYNLQAVRGDRDAVDTFSYLMIGWNKDEHLDGSFFISDLLGKVGIDVQCYRL